MESCELLIDPCPAVAHPHHLQGWRSAKWLGDRKSPLDGDARAGTPSAPPAPTIMEMDPKKASQLRWEGEKVPLQPPEAPGEFGMRGFSSTRGPAPAHWRVALGLLHYWLGVLGARYYPDFLGAHGLGSWGRGSAQGKLSDLVPIPRRVLEAPDRLAMATHAPNQAWKAYARMKKNTHNYDVCQHQL